jgi:hypothetical protein
MDAGSNQESKDCSWGASGEDEGWSSCVTFAILDALAKPTTKGVEKFALCNFAVENPVVKGLSGSSVGFDEAPYVDGTCSISS